MISPPSVFKLIIFKSEMKFSKLMISCIVVTSHVTMEQKDLILPSKKGTE